MFVNFIDHGAPGLVAFPKGSLYADQLNDTFTYMHTNKMYNKMVVYFEACESGSMFNNKLADNLNIYAVTAANPGEPSAATYCPPNDAVNGKHINSCLGDLFSTSWMENIEKVGINSESLESQFTLLTSEVTFSHVSQYGDMTFDSDKLNGWFGESSAPTLFESLQQSMDDVAPEERLSDDYGKKFSAINSRDAHVTHLYARTLNVPDDFHKATLDLSTELNRRMRVDHVFEQFLQVHNIDRKTSLPENITCFNCIRKVMDAWRDNCGYIYDYDLKYVRDIVLACDSATSSDEEWLINSTLKVCSH